MKYRVECELIKNVITNGANSTTQADMAHSHIVNCIKCLNFKARYLKVTRDVLLKAMLESE